MNSPTSSPKISQRLRSHTPEAWHRSVPSVQSGPDCVPPRHLVCQTVLVSWNWGPKWWFLLTETRLEISKSGFVWSHVGVGRPFLNRPETWEWLESLTPLFSSDQTARSSSPFGNLFLQLVWDWILPQKILRRKSYTEEFPTLFFLDRRCCPGSCFHQSRLKPLCCEFTTWRNLRKKLKHVCMYIYISYIII